RRNKMTAVSPEMPVYGNAYQLTNSSTEGKSNAAGKFSETLEKNLNQAFESMLTEINEVSKIIFKSYCIEHLSVDDVEIPDMELEQINEGDRKKEAEIVFEALHPPTSSFLLSRDRDDVASQHNLYLKFATPFKGNKADVTLKPKFNITRNTITFALKKPTVITS